MKFKFFCLEISIHRRHHHSAPRIRTMDITWSKILGVNMANAVLKADDNGVTATLTFLDKHGNTAAPAAPPVWSLSVDGIVTMTVSDDGLSASFAPASAGDVDVNVVAEGDPTPGVNTIHGTGHISVVAAEAASVDLAFGPVT